MDLVDEDSRQDVYRLKPAPSEPYPRQHETNLQSQDLMDNLSMLYISGASLSDTFFFIQYDVDTIFGFFLDTIRYFGLRKDLFV